MMGIKFFTTAIAVYRNFSTKAYGQTTKWGQNSYKSKTEKNPITRIKWTPEQKEILSCVSAGHHSVFITGCAGTGKTILVKHIIKLLKRFYGPSKVFVTAPTGVAACALKGQTLHSFAGIGYPMADRKTLLDRVLSDRAAYRRWKKTEVLVIDEVSMVDADLFDSLEFIAKTIKEVDVVWGGIRLIVSGDFFQLPPVIDQQCWSGKEFAFEADCWNSSFDFQIELTKVFRQADPRLIKLLHGIRKGESDPEELQFLEQYCSLKEPDDSVVRLYPRKGEVEKVNDERMASLGEEVVIYKAVDSGEDRWKRQLNKGIAPEKLVVCEGARVMLTKNLNTWRQLVNGATGTIIGFCDPEDMDVSELCPEDVLPLVKFDSGPEVVIEPEVWNVMDGDSVVAQRKQMPLILAWALSIHKCQGMSLDRVHTDLTRAFGCGMVYVALSRVRSLEGLHLSGFAPSKIKAHPKVLHFYQSFANNMDEENEDSRTKTSNGGTQFRFSLSEWIRTKYRFSLSRQNK